jgi:hypothetical protein
MSALAAVAPDEGKPKLTKATPVGLRDAGVTESWLEDVIEKEPTILTTGRRGCNRAPTPSGKSWPP